MGTPGLRLIQDLLAKSVAKWSGDVVKSIKDEKKTETKRIKCEYIETETVPLDVKTEINQINLKEDQVGLKRKLVETETEKTGKQKKKAHKMSKFGVCGSIKEVVKNEAEDIHVSDNNDNKSLITRLLETSAAKFALDGDEYDKARKKCTIDKIQSKKKGNMQEGSRH